MARLIIDPCVEDELWVIWSFIARDNPDAATRVVDAAYATFETLAVNPGLGRLRRFRSPALKHCFTRSRSGVRIPHRPLSYSYLQEWYCLNPA